MRISLYEMDPEGFLPQGHTTYGGVYLTLWFDGPETSQLSNPVETKQR